MEEARKQTGIAGLAACRNPPTPPHGCFYPGVFFPGGCLALPEYLVSAVPAPIPLAALQVANADFL